MERHSINVQELLDRLNNSKDLPRNARFSSKVYAAEPLIKTGRQLMREQQKQTQEQAARPAHATRPTAGPASGHHRATSSADTHVRSLFSDIMSFLAEHGDAATGDEQPATRHAAASAPSHELPEAYRAMRSITRWQEVNGHGRWLTEAELFVRQAKLMADFEDDHPYTGTFKAYFPTYNVMSDQQLRGYFTWRAAVRHGSIGQTSTSFAFVYLYELINGIGVANPRAGFQQIKSFWEAYRTFAPELDRYVPEWLVDYAVYHNLDPQLLADTKTVRFDKALAHLQELALHLARLGEHASAGKRNRRAPALPLPPDSTFEQGLLNAIDTLSTYRIGLSRLYRDCPDDARHVACAVFAHLEAYYRRNRKRGLVESLFGVETTMSYTPFTTAVFFEEHLHADADYELDPLQRYCCEHGRWTCSRVWGARDKSSRLGAIMRACDRKLRVALAYPHTLKPREESKYLEQIIDREIADWLAWKEAHAPREVHIDLSKLSGIRAAAAETREALLIDEEREDEAGVIEAGTQVLTAPGPDCALDTGAREDAPGEAAHPQTDVIAEEPMGDQTAALSGTPGEPATHDEAPHRCAHKEPAGPLTPEQATFVMALLDGTTPALPPGASVDMMVDAINDALFDLLGDTALEFGPDGPVIIEDYIDDLRGVLS